MEYGDPRLPERFWKKVVPDPASGCWLWNGAIKKRPNNYRQYGSFTFEGKPTLLSQVLTSVLFPGYDKVQFKPAYTCDNFACANPEHVYLIPRNTCKRGHKNPERDAARNCLECKRASSNRGRRRTSGSLKRRPLPEGKSIFGDSATAEIWRPTGWPKEVLDGRLNTGSEQESASVS